MLSVQAEKLASQAQLLYSLPADGVKSSEPFRAWTGSTSDRTLLLESISAPPTPSFRPLHLLYLLQTELPGSWPAIDLIKHHARILKYLPEKSSPEAANDQLSWTVEATSKLVKRSYPSFNSFLKPSSKPALRTTSPGNYITHNGLAKFVEDFTLPVETTPGQGKPIVGIALPNGPLLAAVCIAVTTYYISAPVNPAAGPEQFQSDVLQGGAKCILTTSQEYEKLKLSDPWVSANGIQIILVDWTLGDDITLSHVDGRPLSGLKPTAPNEPDDISLILFTSGTSGSKKVVPLTNHSLVAGIAFVIDSWGLTPQDVCLNMMPLFHV